MKWLFLSLGLLGMAFLLTAITGVTALTVRLTAIHNAAMVVAVIELVVAVILAAIVMIRLTLEE